jgi:hypothetical protein
MGVNYQRRKHMLLNSNYDLHEILAKQKAINNTETLMQILCEVLPELDKEIAELAPEDRQSALALYANEVRATAFRVHMAIVNHAAKRKFLARRPGGEHGTIELRTAVERYGEELQRIARVYRYL